MDILRKAEEFYEAMEPNLLYTIKDIEEMVGAGYPDNAAIAEFMKEEGWVIRLDVAVRRQRSGAKSFIVWIPEEEELV